VIYQHSYNLEEEKENQNESDKFQLLSEELCQSLLNKDAVESLQNKWNSTICDSEFLFPDDLVLTDDPDELNTKVFRKRISHSEARELNNNEIRSVK
jgi:hypothetical protein